MDQANAQGVSARGGGTVRIFRLRPPKNRMTNTTWTVLFTIVLAVVCILFFGLAGQWLVAIGVYVVLLPIAMYVRFHDTPRPYALSVSANGDVTFRWERRSLVIPARDILLLHGVRVADHVGNVSWTMVVKDRAGGVINVDYFDDAREFVGLVREVNPYITVKGERPSFWFPE